MKNKEIVKEIKGLQAKLETLIGKIEKKPVAGWYINNSTNYDKYLMYIDVQNNFCYGFTSDGKWFENESKGVYVDDDQYPASPEEVEDRLIQEAEKRGYIGGVTIKYDLCNVTLDSDELRFNHEDNEIALGRHWILSKGKWAEIIEQPKLTLGGHEVTVSENGSILFLNGGFVYTDTAHKIVESNIDSFLLGGQLEKTLIQVDELQELLTKIDSK